jgi:hypothetical protein
MEILTTVISSTLLIGLITSPVLILVRLTKLNIKYKLIVFLTLGIIITSTITLIFAWWVDTSNQILLTHYGYDFEALNDTERFVNVSVENMERVKSLEISMMGIGWPLKAFMMYGVYSPYLLIVYLITYVLEKHKKREHTPPNIV